MTKTIENLFLVLHHISSAVVVLLFVCFFKKLSREKGIIALTLYCLVDLLLNFTAQFLPVRWHLYINAFSTILEYSIFSYFIYLNVSSRLVRKIIMVLSLLFIAFAVIFNWVTAKFESFDSVPIGIETILILLYSFCFLYEQANSSRTSFIYEQYPFWIIVGIMLYLGGSFFIFMFYRYISHSLLSQYWSLTNLFYALMNLLFITALIIFLKSKDNKKVSSRELYLI